MGSRSKVDIAYIAGFLDGDGSLMLQIKKRKDGSLGLRFMVTICFYQDTRHEAPLHWIRDVCTIGYISRRKDGISELRINGFVQSKRILLLLMPYLRFKKIQAQSIYEACSILTEGNYTSLSDKQKRRLVDLVLTVQKENYATKRKRSRDELLQSLGLTP